MFIEGYTDDAAEKDKLYLQRAKVFRKDFLRFS